MEEIILQDNERKTSMLKRLQWLGFIGCGALGTLISCGLIVQIWDRVNVVPTVQAQGNTNTVIINGLRFNDPIEVVKVLGAGQEAVVDVPTRDDLQSFPGKGNFSGRHKEWRNAYRVKSDDDWLSALSFVLRNRTSKTIDLVDIHVFLPQAGWKISEFFFGQIPAAFASITCEGRRAPVIISEPISFGPGEEMTFALADNQHYLSRLISKAEPLSEISVVYVDFGVTLEDGVGWAEYQYAGPDPKNPCKNVILTRGNYLGCYFPGPLMGPPAPCIAKGGRACL
jgi:hypothetical protein